VFLNLIKILIQEMLLFIYSGKVKNLVAHAIELLKAADIYQLDNLKGHYLLIFKLILSK